MAMEVLRRQQSSIETNQLQPEDDLLEDMMFRHKLLVRSKSLPVQVLESKRRNSIDRLNRNLRLSLQIQLTSTIMKSEEPSHTEKGGVRFDPAVLLQVAVTNGDEAEIKELISEHGKSIVDLKEPTGLPPIMRAIFEGQVNSLLLLIDSGADVQAHDPEEWNILHVAAAMDDIEATEVILSSLSHRKLIQLFEEENACGQKPVELAEDEDMIKFYEEALAKLKAGIF